MQTLIAAALLGISLLGIRPADTTRTAISSAAAEAKGRADAERDLEAGHLILRTFGISTSGFPKHVRARFERLGIRVRSLGCIVDAQIVAETAAYNAVMREEIKKRFGPHTLDEVEPRVASPAVPTASPGHPGSLRFSTIWKEQGTGITKPREQVISTQEQWAKVWREIVANRTPRPAAPAVDFSISSLILIARGEVGDACRSAEIERVDADNGTYRVAVQDLRPPMSCSCPPVTVQPVHVIAVPRVAAAVSATYRPVTVGEGCN